MTAHIQLRWVSFYYLPFANHVFRVEHESVGIRAVETERDVDRYGYAVSGSPCDVLRVEDQEF